MNKKDRFESCENGKDPEEDSKAQDAASFDPLRDIARYRLSQDFAATSLSDRYVPWDQIVRRLEAVSGADMVIALYEPSSRYRPGQLAHASDFLQRNLDGATPVAVAREAM